jgi:hypothetical protein
VSLSTFQQAEVVSYKPRERRSEEKSWVPNRNARLCEPSRHIACRHFGEVQTGGKGLGRASEILTSTRREGFLGHSSMGLRVTFTFTCNPTQTLSQ